MTPTNCPHCGMGWDEKMGEFECRSYPAGSGVVRSTACVEISRLRSEVDALRAGVAVVVPDSVRSAGQKLSNIAFNMKQLDSIPEDWRESCKIAQEAWDSAIRSQEGGA